MKDYMKNTIFENIDDAVELLKDTGYKEIGPFTYKKDEEKLHIDFLKNGYKISSGDRLKFF